MAVVKLFANLRKAAGCKEVIIQGSNLSEVITSLINQCSGLSGYLLEDGQIRPHVIITINGHVTTDLMTAVAAQDQVAIFPPIAGG